MTTRKVLLLAPEANRADVTASLQEGGWEVHPCDDVGSASDLLGQSELRVGIVALDQADDAFQADLERFLPTSGKVNWVALIERDQLREAACRRLIANHFYDYHSLPLDADRLLFVLGHAHGMAELDSRVTHSHAQDSLGEYEMVGTSERMRTLFRNLRKMAAAEAPVLIRGESGTGKELAAVAIHERSSRAKGSFIPVNCGALPANLIQSELFGHEKGSFTGAHQRKVGRIEAASGGTIFLDEIGDLPMDLQVNLLRFLQERTIERVGSTEPIEVDVRVIAATHVDLEQAVREGRFREDLYYRLNVLHLEMPPLRERGEDVELLAKFFFDRFAQEQDRRIKGFNRDALDVIRLHDWPGNVRELINRIRRAVVMCEGQVITPVDLGLERRQHARRPNQTLEQARFDAEKTAIHAALQRARSNVSKAARDLGVSRVTLYRLMEKYEIAG